MKSNLTILSSLQYRFKQAVSTLLLMGLLWLGTSLPASATPNSALIATSADSISKQVSGKADKLKGSAKDAIGKAQSSMENRKGEVDRKAKDGLTEAKIAVDSNAARAENGVEKAADSVKGFFGK